MIPFTFLLSLPVHSETIDFSELVERNGLMIEKFTNKPFTGKVTGIEKGFYKNGKKGDGHREEYHENGQLNFKEIYKDGY